MEEKFIGKGKQKMIKIIKTKPNKYIMVCDYCDCKFSYELIDVRKDYYGEYLVICPCCNTKQMHSNRKREVIEEESQIVMVKHDEVVDRREE